MYYFSDRLSTKKFFDNLLEKMEVDEILKIGAIFTRKQKMLPFASMQVYLTRQPAGRKYGTYTHNNVLHIVRIK